MNTAAQIAEAADLMAEFNPAAAQVFRTQPFRREMIAAAFRAGFRRHSDYSALVCRLIENVAKLDRLNRIEGSL